MSYNSVNRLIGIQMEIFILTMITDNNHICLHDNLCVACANLTAASGVLTPPVDGKIALIFLNSLEM